MQPMQEQERPEAVGDAGTGVKAIWLWQVETTGK